MLRDEDEEAVRWAERAARSPGAHVLIAMIAAVAALLAGDKIRANTWADNVRARNPKLTSQDFFHAFPVKTAQMRTRVADALQTLDF
jgi:hypothetical protein